MGWIQRKDAESLGLPEEDPQRAPPKVHGCQTRLRTASGERPHKGIGMCLVDSGGPLDCGCREEVRESTDEVGDPDQTDGRHGALTGDPLLHERGQAGGGDGSGCRRAVVGGCLYAHLVGTSS